MLKNVKNLYLSAYYCNVNYSSIVARGTIETQICNLDILYNNYGFKKCIFFNKFKTLIR